MVRRVWRHKKKTQQPIEVASHRAGKQTQGRAGRCLAANCLHWGNDVASLKACKVPRPGAGNRRCYRKSPGAHARTMADTHTHTQKCLGVPQKHTPGDKGSVYQRHTHTPEPPSPPPNSHDTCQHIWCGINILWARLAVRLADQRENVRGVNRTAHRSAPTPQSCLGLVSIIVQWRGR